MTKVDIYYPSLDGNKITTLDSSLAVPDILLVIKGVADEIIDLVLPKFHKKTQYLTYSVREMIANSYDAILDRGEDYGGKVRVGLRTKGRSVIINMSDNGMGIKAGNSIVKRSGFSKNYGKYIGGYGCGERNMQEGVDYYKRLSSSSGSLVYLRASK